MRFRSVPPPRRLAVAALLFLAAAAQAQDTTTASAPPDELWYSVRLDGRKVGELNQRRRVDADGVRTEQILRLEIERDGQPLQVIAEQLTLESVEGRPLQFRNRMNMGGSQVDIDGEVDSDITRLRIAQGDRVTEQRQPWPPGALLAEGQRLAAIRGGAAPGTRYRFLQFDLDALRALAVDVEVLGEQQVELPGGVETLLALRQTISVDGVSVVADLWLDRSDFSTRRMRLPMLGSHLDAMACSRECAAAANQPGDLLLATSVAAPRALSLRERSGVLRYRIGVEGAAPTAVDLPGQQREALAGGWQIDIDPRGGDQGPPQPADLQPSRWLQSDDPELTALAGRIVGRARSDRDRMRRLERGVSEHIATKSLRIGYASALEASRLAEGDCTEHALLLAALGRAIGIPTRVASGLAYVTQLSGRASMFVPHAWVYAWIDGRWQGFDAALSQFGSGHLALDVGDGDPFAFYSGLELLGRLQIEAIEPVRR